MGIKYLYKFFKEECNCKTSIKLVSISELSDKKIVVDISIYLYKFESDNVLIENIYLMLSIFKYYNIIPIFIFDGKPPNEKNKTIENRNNIKIESEKEYNRLKEQIKDMDSSLMKEEIISNMDILKKKFVYMTKEKINNIKEIIRYFGYSYFDAPGEADELCAMLVIKKKFGRV